MDNKISREVSEMLFGNEINPKFGLFKENPTWKAFFKKYKDFTEIKDRLVEFSKKIGLSVGEFKNLSRIKKRKRVSNSKKRNGRS